MKGEYLLENRCKITALSRSRSPALKCFVYFCLRSPDEKLPDANYTLGEEKIVPYTA